MSLYRLVARDRLKDLDVRPYEQTDLGAPDPGSAPPPEHDGGELALDPVDLSGIAEYLLFLGIQEQAQAIIEAAERQAEQIGREAAARGLADGREAGEQEILPAIVAFGEAGQGLIVLEEQLVSRYTPEMVRLALEIAAKVIGRAVDEDPRIAADILERAKREVTDARQIRIWLNPQDHEVLSRLRPDLVKVGHEGGRTIEVLQADDIGRGGCRLETEMGLVDATIPTQLAEIRRQLLDAETGAPPDADGPVRARRPD
jgi:flagellar biosynthesis/type III secretory pathway protein FliH